MTKDEILARLKGKYPEAVVDTPELIDFTVVVKPEMLTEVAAFLHDECELDYLADVTAVDRQNGSRWSITCILSRTRRQVPSC